jgi:hypothetical protein
MRIALRCFDGTAPEREYRARRDLLSGVSVFDNPARSGDTPPA